MPALFRRPSRWRAIRPFATLYAKRSRHPARRGRQARSRQTANIVRPRDPTSSALSGGLFHSSAATTQPRRHPGPRCQAHRPRGEGKGRYRLNMKLQNAGPRALGTLSPEAPDGIQESGYRFPESSGSMAQLLQYRQQVCAWNHKSLTDSKYQLNSLKDAAYFWDGPARYHSEISLSTTCARRYSRRVLVLDQFGPDADQSDGIAEHGGALAVPHPVPRPNAGPHFIYGYDPG